MNDSLKSLQAGISLISTVYCENRELEFTASNLALFYGSAGMANGKIKSA